MPTMSESSANNPMIRNICGVQSHVDFADTSANLQRMLRWLEHSDTAGMDLVVFPECMLSGYCFSSLEEAMPHTETVPGPATQAIQRVCESRSMHVAFGLLERDSQGRVFNSCPLVGPAGVIANYRKVHLPFLGIDRFVTPGDRGFQAFDAGEMRVGIHICYDGSFPESSRCLALDGADLLILPTNWPPGAETFARYLPNARALENNVYFMSVNRVGTERGFRFIGNSRICDPNGLPMAEASHEEEGTIRAKIDLGRARNKRLVRVPKEHIIDRWADRRPESYSRIVEPHQLQREIQ
jgi:predicted amidohydrolase